MSSNVANVQSLQSFKQAKGFAFGVLIFCLFRGSRWFGRFVFEGIYFYVSRFLGFVWLKMWWNDLKYRLVCSVHKIVIICMRPSLPIAYIYSLIKLQLPITAFTNITAIIQIDYIILQNFPLKTNSVSFPQAFSPFLWHFFRHIQHFYTFSTNIKQYFLAISHNLAPNKTIHKISVGFRTIPRVLATSEHPASINSL